MIKQSFETMLFDLKQMTSTDMEQIFHQIDCPLSYQDIVTCLSQTWNDGAVGDQLYATYSLHPQQCVYPASFMDEAILEIAQREKFPFRHFGCSALELQKNRQLVDNANRIERQLAVFEKIMMLAKHFHLVSLETMLYEAHDETDILGTLFELLEDMMLLGKQDPTLYHKLIRFVDAYKKVFTKTSHMVKQTMEFQKATAYIACGDARGNQLFKHLLKQEVDKTDVVLHYGLCYLDDDEAKTVRIFREYRHLLDKDSDAYPLIQEILEEIRK